jgi:hypothetical protein
MVSMAAASFTTNLKIKQCDKNGCKLVQKRVALDATSNGTEKFITVSGTDQDALTLQYGNAVVGGPRVYLIEEEGDDKNKMFLLKNQEFTFDAEMSTMGCGFNAALYFVGMTENQGGAVNGTNYCDAQAVGGTFCSEMDIMEANTVAQQYTTHACVDACASHTTGVSQCKGTGSPSTVCDQSGCGLNPFRYGPGTSYNLENPNPKWHGPSSAYALDSSKKFTVVTQFHADSAGELLNITRFYVQSGARIDLPTLYVRPPSDGSHYGPFAKPAITKDYCTDIYDRWDGAASYAPLGQMGKNMENGMVLAMSAWYAKESYVDGKPTGSQTGMSWLDGVNQWGKYVKAGPCHTTTTDAGGPYHATFSDIRIGDIGSTTNVPPAPPAPPSPPAPGPPAPPSPPSPPPAAGQCCYGASGATCASMSGCQGGFCGQSQGNCENNCNGKWCPKLSDVLV